MQLMVLKSNAFIKQNEEREKLLQKFLLEKKKTLEQYPNLYPKFVDGKFILAYKPRDLESLITDLQSLRLSKSMAEFNILKYGYESEMDYILNCLGYEKKSDKKIRVSDCIKKQAKYFEDFYKVDKECFIRLRNKSTGQYRAYRIEHVQDPYRLQAILKSQYFNNNMNDMMYSLNLYNNMYKADEDSLFSLQNIGIDVDFDTYKYTKDMVLKILEENYGMTIPTPNLVEHSHRIRLIYSIEDVAVTKKSLNVYKHIGKELVRRLKDDVGIEGSISMQPSTTYCRFLNSINTKDNSHVEVILKNMSVYKMRDMQMQLLEKTDWCKVTTNKNVSYIHNDYGFCLGRLEDLRKIQKIRQQGYRENLAFVFRNYCYLAGYSEDETFNMLVEFNNNFDNPLPINHLDGDTKHLKRKQYKFRTHTFLELFDITPKDEEILGLSEAKSPTEIRRRKLLGQKETYYKKLKNEGKKTRNEQVDEKKEKVKDLVLQGLGTKDIALQLGFGESTVRRYKSNLKKEGLI